LIESLIDSFGKLERVRSRVTIDQDNSVYYNIDRDQDRSSASDLAYGFSIDKVPSHEGLVRSKFRGFEVSIPRFRRCIGFPGAGFSQEREGEREFTTSRLVAPPFRGIQISRSIFLSFRSISPSNPPHPHP
jgi:hypothetical protein